MSHFFAPEEAQGPCVVCGEKLNSEHFAVCVRCMKPFHFRMTESVKGVPECGYTYIDDTNYTLRFVCQNCSQVQVA